jgi:hypothetical protein
MYSLLLWLQYIIDALYDLGKTVGKGTFSTVSDVSCASAAIQISAIR